MLEFTLPQFLLYVEEANRQRAYALNIKSLSELVSAVLGKGKSNSKGRYMAEDDPDNYVWVIKKAKEELMERTGKKKFTLPEIWSHIHKKD